MAESSASRSPGLKGRINVRVSEKVTLENLHSILNQVVGMTGCRTCGLVGVDFVLSGDPEELQQVAKLPGVVSAGFSA